MSDSKDHDDWLDDMRQARKFDVQLRATSPPKMYRQEECIGITYNGRNWISFTLASHEAPKLIEFLQKLVTKWKEEDTERDQS